MKKHLLVLTLFSLLLSPLSPLSHSTTKAQGQGLSDLEADDPSLSAIEALYTEGIIKGYDDGTFRSQTTINRAEFVKILVESLVENPRGSACFSDVNTEWFAPYICTAKEKGWVNGYSDGSFKPGNPINFAEASKIIVNAFGLEKTDSMSPWYRPYVETLEENKAIPTSVGDLDKELMRGEMAETIWRVKEHETSKDSLSYEEVEGNLIRLQSCDELEDRFLSDPYIIYYEDDLEDSDLTSSTENDSSSEGSSSDFSTTNVQVDGVDEPDITKNDGKNIYMIKDDSVRIIQAYPATSMQQLAEITYEEEEFSPEEILLEDNTLIVIGDEENQNLDYDYGFEAEINLYYHAWRTGVYLYDVSDAQNPELTRHLSFDGYYTDARRVGDNLYLILNKNDFIYYGYDYDPQSINAEEVLPRFTDSMTGKEDFLVSCSSIRYLPHQETLDYVIASAIPLDNETPVDAEVILGESNAIYASEENLYITSNNYDNADYYYDWNNVKTLIHRFSLNDGKITYKNSGKVKGALLNQFSMDEHEGYFRIATTKGDLWDAEHPSSNAIFILNEHLNTVGSLENLAEGERIYSTRFLGDTGYMVTFKKVDPLFTFDLSDPKNPVVLGELKIPGYSDYLHPYDETHLLGFGKDAEDASEEEKELRNLDFAWYQGMKISLFDVSDLTHPKQLFSVGIGDRGTSSELLYDHKALLFSKSKNLLAFPIEVANTYEEIVFEGAYIYNVDLEKGFTLKGTDAHELSAIQRILYIGNTLYTISEREIHALDIESMEETAQLDL